MQFGVACRQWVLPPPSSPSRSSADSWVWSVCVSSFPDSLTEFSHNRGGILFSWWSSSPCRRQQKMHQIENRIRHIIMKAWEHNWGQTVWGLMYLHTCCAVLWQRRQSFIASNCTFELRQMHSQHLPFLQLVSSVSYLNSRSSRHGRRDLFHVLSSCSTQTLLVNHPPACTTLPCKCCSPCRTWKQLPKLVNDIICIPVWWYHFHFYLTCKVRLLLQQNSTVGIFNRKIRASSPF